MTKDKVSGDLSASLDAFAETVKSERPKAYWFTLPQEVRDVIRQSPHATHTIVKWLHEQGYTEATYPKIEHYRKARRANDED